MNSVKTCMVLIFAVVQFTFLETYGQNKFFRKDYTYLNQTGSYYKIHTIHGTWHDALAKCAMEQATLWFPKNQAETYAVINLWNKKQPGFHYVYIGVSDLAQKDVYVTVDGHLLDDVFNYWAPGEPKLTEEGCVILRREGVLNSFYCDELLPFICKKSHLPEDPAAWNGKCDKSNPDGRISFRSDYTYLDQTKTYYKVEDTPRNWFAAKKRCAMQGASLWYPENLEDAKTVINLVNKLHPVDFFFIGISDLIEKGAYETIDGRPIKEVFNVWTYGEPNNGNGDVGFEDCLILRNDGHLNDDRCLKKYPFVCKKTLDSLDNPDGKMVFRDDYTYVESERSFYKMHSTHQNWVDAKKQCVAENATFWYPKDQAEADAVIKFWKKVQPGFLWVFVGVSDLVSAKGMYETIDGRPLEDVYNKWDAGEPNNGGTYGGGEFGEEHCLTLRREAQLNDHKCDRKFPYVCKRTLASLEKHCAVPVPNPVSRPLESNSQQRIPQKPALTNRPPTAVRPEDIVSSITTSVQCGVVAGGNERQPLIFNGQAYARGEWPWVVAIYRKTSGGLTFICSGTLVSDRHVVTAAHCMQAKNSLTSKKDIVVKIGVYNLDDWGDDIAVARTVASAVIHEGYNSRTLANDILVLTFERSVEFTTNIRPACLWSGSPELSVVVGASGVVAGWGLSESGPGGKGEPKIVRLPIVSTGTCRASRPDFHKLTSEFTLCAGDRNGVGPCLGDSGGGFYLIEGGRWQLRGVVSLSLRPDDGSNSCNLNEYIVLTDAAKYVDWIRSAIGR